MRRVIVVDRLLSLSKGQNDKDNYKWYQTSIIMLDFLLTFLFSTCEHSDDLTVNTSEWDYTDQSSLSEEITLDFVFRPYVDRRSTTNVSSSERKVSPIGICSVAVQ